MNVQKTTYQLDVIQNPQDIEKYDEFDGEGICITTHTVQPHRNDNQLLQIQNHLITIRNNLTEFKDLVQSMNTKIISQPTQITNIKERANDELTKAHACKIQCLNKIKTQFDMENYLNQLKKENDIIKKSLEDFRKQYCFATSSQLRQYARAFKPPMNGNFIYVNLYHDKISGEVPYLKLAKEENGLEIQKDDIKIIKDAQLIIDLRGPNQRWISYSYEIDSIQEKLIYDYLKRNNALKKQILQFNLEFYFLIPYSTYDNEIKQEIQQGRAKICNLLLGKFLHELIIKTNGSLENYFQFVKQYILENQKQELIDQQRYYNLLSQLQNPELIQGIGK